MSKTTIADIRNNAFPPITVAEGSHVVWRNLDPYPHSVETLAADPNYFNAGAMLPGETSSPIRFAKPGTFNYICRYHTGMAGSVTVNAKGVATPMDLAATATVTAVMACIIFTASSPADAPAIGSL